MDLSDLRTKLAAAIRGSRQSQTQFAISHGFSFSTLNKFLRGELRNPRLSTIQGYERAIRGVRRSQSPSEQLPR